MQQAMVCSSPVTDSDHVTRVPGEQNVEEIKLDEILKVNQEIVEDNNIISGY